MSGGRRVRRFVAVGALGFLVQLAVVQGLTAVGLHYLVATTLGVEAAILHNFVWHLRWTWRDRAAATTPTWRRLVRFNGISALGSMAGNAVVAWVLVEHIGVTVLVANCVAVAAIGFLNFHGFSRWVFGTPVGGGNQEGLPRATGVGRRAVPLSVACVWMAAIPVPGHAAELTSETERAWRRHVQAVEARIDRELAQPGRFLAIDHEAPADRAAAMREAREGGVVVTNVAAGGEEGRGIELPSGTIHHWRGLAFVPGATVDELIEAVADPAGKRAHRQEDVIESRVLSRSANGLRLFLRLQRRVIVSATYNTEHDVIYRTHAAGRASSRSVATRIAEVANVGRPDEYERPRGVDRGYLWGLNSYWRYQAVPGGVVVELESLTLSRGVPWGVGAVVRPLVDRVARESVTRTLVALRARFADSSH
jgi:putative flippase GtrA